MEPLNEAARHASEVRWWIERIRSQPGNERRAYWLHWRGHIERARGQQAAERLHRDVTRQWTHE